MNPHPSIDSLVAHLDAPASAVGSHLDACSECRTRASRLAGGLALIDEAQRTSIPPLPWERMESVLQDEAARLSVEIRAGRLRPVRVVPAWVGGALAMAAGVALVAGVQAWRHHEAAPSTLAHRVLPAATPTTAPSLAPQAPRVDGVVLLASGGALYQAPSEAGVPLARVDVVHEGARVETPGAGRAVFTVGQGWTADLRARSALQLARLRDDRADLTLEHGEVALAPAAGETRALRLVDGPWSVEAHGAVMARSEATVLRVVVLAGHVDVRRDGGDALTVTGPMVVELPLDGGAPVQSSAGASDPAALDLALFASQRPLALIPDVDPSAALTLRDQGALPSALEAARFAQPGVLEARRGATAVRLDLASSEPPRWTPVHPTAVVAARAPTLHAPTEIPTPARAADPVDARIAAFEHNVPARLQRCFDNCREQNRCRAPMQGQVRFDVSADGHAVIRSIDASAEGARSCLVNQAQFLPAPRTDSGFTFAMPYRFAE